MNFNESLAFYLVVGLAVVTAQALTERAANHRARMLSMFAAWLFWPLYLPLLLAAKRTPDVDPPVGSSPRDGLTLAIEQVEQELNDALSSLDGWAEDVLHRNPERLGELRAALSAQAERIRDMEALVARERNRPVGGAEISEAAKGGIETGEFDLESDPHGDRWQRSEQARRENMSRLAGVCRQSRADLLATLAWIRELVSMIHLAKFTGAPAARAEELVAQIAAAVESISSLSAPVTPGSNALGPPLAGLELTNLSLEKEPSR